MIAAIILAAGASERMGAPKAGLRYQGTSFLATILEASDAAGLRPRCVVIGRDYVNTLPDIALHDAVLTRNPDVSTGPIGSTILGIRAIINQPVDAAVVWHVDRPHVRVATIRAIVDCFRDGQPSIAVPTFGGRRGHPILISRSVFPEVLANPEQGLRAVVRLDPHRVATVAVDDPAVLEDIDTPEDYERLLRGAPWR